MQPAARVALEQSVAAWRRGAWHAAVTYLLPGLEQALRLLFVDANRTWCAESLKTAVMYEYYVTYEHMLSYTLQLENGALLINNPENAPAPTVPNKLVDVIGAGTFCCLRDVLLLPWGPRLRDHISHGELFLDGMSRPLCTTLLNSALHIFRYVHSRNGSGTADASPLLFAHYRSVFHIKTAAARAVGGFAQATIAANDALFAGAPRAAAGSGAAAADVAAVNDYLDARYYMNEVFIFRDCIHIGAASNGPN